MEILGKTAIVTGAGTSIGRELAREFARHGARVVCAARRPKNLHETVEMIKSEGGTAIAVPTDITEPSQVDNLVKTTIEHFSHIDLLFNNAGSLRAIGATWEINPDQWWEDVKVNLFGTFLCCHAVLPHMIAQDQGLIFNMDGGGGTPGPNIGGSAYGSSKAALLRFSETLAGELNKIGSSVLVICINPGFVRSEMTEQAVNTPEKAQWLSHIPELLGSVHELAPDVCAKSVMKIINIASPELSGRIFRQDTDYEWLANNLQLIQQQNLLVLKYVTK